MYYNTSHIPNIYAMKLSSFHKQKGDFVLMVKPGDKIIGKCDVIYIIREKKQTPFPPSRIYERTEAKFLGKAFEGHEDFITFKPYVMSVRPDYKLYEKDDSPFSDAQYVLYSYGFSLIENMQDFHRKKILENKTRWTIVADENLWDFKEEYLLKILDRIIKEEENIYFLNPIKLSLLIRSEAIRERFYKIKFARKSKLNYINDLGNDFKYAKPIIDFFSTFSERNKTIKYKPPEFKIITKDHWKKPETALYDFENCMRIMSYATKKKLRINFKYPNRRLTTPVWNYFEFFKNWSAYNHKKSYVKALLLPAVKATGRKEWELINDIRWWKNGPKLQQLVHLLCNYEQLMRETAFVNWDEKDDILEKIDFNYIKEHEHDFDIFYFEKGKK